MNTYHIYKITCITTNRCYYGSTKFPIKFRLKKHVNSYNVWLKNTSGPYCTSYEVLMNNNYVIKLLESSYTTRDEANKLEGYYQLNNDCVNIKISGRTKSEYYIQNRDAKLEYQAEYYVNNKCVITKKAKQRYINNRQHIVCECGISVLNVSIRAHLKSKMHMGLINDREGYMKNRILCECGCTPLKKSYKTHTLSKRHLQYMDRI